MKDDIKQVREFEVGGQLFLDQDSALIKLNELQELESERDRFINIHLPILDPFKGFPWECGEDHDISLKLTEIDLVIGEIKVRVGIYVKIFPWFNTYVKFSHDTCDYNTSLEDVVQNILYSQPELLIDKSSLAIMEKLEEFSDGIVEEGDSLLVKERLGILK